MMRKQPGQADDSARAGRGLLHLVLATLFWIAVALALFFYFRQSGR